MSQITKNLTLVIITGNQNKIREINEILTEFPLSIKSYTEVFDQLPEIIEDGNTFSENALKKVAIAKQSDQHIFIGEDSGIEVEALDGRPGIYSARYAGKNATRNEMCSKLLSELENKTNRNAQYQASIAIKYPNNTTKTVSGIVKGNIAHSMKGNKGFGYDPIFIPDGYNQTFGELPEEVKHSLSHRYKALELTKKEILNYLNL